MVISEDVGLSQLELKREVGKEAFHVFSFISQSPFECLEKWPSVVCLVCQVMAFSTDVGAWP